MSIMNPLRLPFVLLPRRGHSLSPAPLCKVIVDRGCPTLYPDDDTHESWLWPHGSNRGCETHPRRTRTASDEGITKVEAVCDGEEPYRSNCEKNDATHEWRTPENENWSLRHLLHCCIVRHHHASRAFIGIQKHSGLTFLA